MINVVGKMENVLNVSVGVVGGCNGCVEVCSVGALKREKLVVFDKEKCIDCGACVSACEHDAITLNS